jgi:hypothetical protein
MGGNARESLGVEFSVESFLCLAPELSVGKLPVVV